MSDESITLGKAQQKAFDAVVSGKNALISGQGGTGKSLIVSMLVEHLRYTLHKQVQITASTGMAAVALGGCTIHSWLGTGLAGSWEEAQNMTFSDAAARAQERIMSTDVVFVDEVSMLTGDYIDMFDRWCRVLRQAPDVPFGGLQVVFVCDFLQLPPVVKNKVKWRFAFMAPIWEECGIDVTMLGKSYRQSDQKLVDMLKKVRFGAMDRATLDYFNQCVGRDFGDDVP
jgi:ATP-dependent DNA helicase PIF1